MSFELHSARLLLRPIQLEDAEGMFELNNAGDVLKNTGDKPFADLDEVKLFIKNYDQFKKYKMGRFTLIEKSSNKYIGWCGLKYNDETKEVNLGYRLIPQFRGKGLATEAAEICLDYGFETLNLEEIIGRAISENTPSIKILRNIGMVFEKSFDAHDSICHQYKLTYTEWRNHKLQLNDK